MDLYQSTMRQRNAGASGGDTNALEMQRQMFNAGLDADALKGKYSVMNPDGTMGWHDLNADEAARQHDVQAGLKGQEIRSNEMLKGQEVQSQEKLAGMKLAHDKGMYDKNVLGSFVSNALLNGMPAGDVSKRAGQLGDIITGVRSAGNFPGGTGAAPGGTGAGTPGKVAGKLETQFMVPDAANAVIAPLSTDKATGNEQLSQQAFLNRLGQQQDLLKQKGASDADQSSLLDATIEQMRGKYGDFTDSSVADQLRHKLRFYGRSDLIPDEQKGLLERAGDWLGLGNQTMGGKFASFMNRGQFQQGADREIPMLVNLLNRMKGAAPAQNAPAPAPAAPNAVQNLFGVGRPRLGVDPSLFPTRQVEY